MKWIVEHGVFDNDQEIIDTISQLGYDVYEVNGGHVGLSANNFPSEMIQDPSYIFYGQINSCRRLFRRTPWSIWTPDHVFDWNYYAPKFSNYLLNRNYVIQPFGNVSNYCSGKSGIFIKPNSGYKPFTGRVIHEKIDTELNLIRYEDNIFDEELCVIEDVKTIFDEYRFLVVDNIVVTGSKYLPTEELVKERSLVHNYAQQVVNSVNYFPGLVWTLDIAVIAMGIMGVLEVNSFSAADLYKMDLNKAIETITKSTILRKTNGEI